MLNLRSDLPLSGDSATGFIPWLIAIMVFLGILAISGVNVFDTILSGWSRAVTGTLTVQIPALPADVDDAANIARTEKITAVLNEISAVESVRVLTGSEMDALLAPWLGEGAGMGDLPLPALIDVTLTDDAPSALSELRAAITAVAPDVIVDDHRRWFEHVIELTEGFRVLALCIALVVTVALALTVVYATRASLAEFKEIIAVFHFIGAQDLYIAAQFAKRTFLAASKGSLGGFAGGTTTLLIIGWLARNVESGFLPDVSLGWTFWASLPVIALLAALLAMVTAYVTVLGTLRTMM
jgi:cell division transport system permease protein